MGTVMTVTGPAAEDSLGLVAMHEHLICDLEHSVRGMVAGLDDVQLAIEEVAHLKRAGGSTLVELTGRGAGRDARALSEIAKAAGMSVIAATGFYTEPYYPREVYEQTIPQLANLMIRELTEGIDDTGIRAGIIGELGTRRRHISPAEERVFRAAARAQQATGVAISTHTYAGAELALQQVELLTDAGVKTDRIIIGHLGDRRASDYFAEIARTGVFIQFDHIGMTDLQSDAVRARTIKDMVDRGFGDQILLSSDVCYKSHLHSYGGFGYDHLLLQFVPLLQSVGLTEAVVHGILADNPRRALVGS
jgi:phosphotriesterase-related protein